MAGRIGGNAPKSIGKHYNLARRQVPGAMNSNFSTGLSMATARDNPMRKNSGKAFNTSPGTPPPSDDD